MKKALWLGSYVTDEIAEKMQKLGYYNPASVLSQKNILEGIERVTGKNLDTLGVLAFKGFPLDRKLFIKREKFSHAEGTIDVLAGFLNLKYLNKLSSKKRIVREIRKYLKFNREEELDVFVYEMRSACLDAVAKIKKLRPKAKIHLIVPDLPVFMDLKANAIKRFLKNVDWKSIRKKMRFVDDFILYAEPMANYLGLKDGSWMVVEGSINEGEIKDIAPSTGVESGTTIVMYSGGVKSGFGLENLLDAMSFLGEDFQLWITGGGDLAEVVKEYASKDERIKYYGFLAKREDLKQLQAQATMLVNMRDPNEEASKYCFPSKLFEYMLTGKPVISANLRGIPQEYKEHLVIVEDISPKTIAKAINDVAQKSNEERITIGNKAQEFIKEQKNNVTQSKKIIDFIER